MENKYKKKVFFVDTSTLEILRSTAVSHRGIKVEVEKAIKSYVDIPIIIFRAYCGAYHKVYYGLADRSDFFCDEYYYRLVRGSSPFSKEVAIKGCNEFEFKCMGAFKQIKEALQYKEFLINRDLNKGIESYNLDFDTVPFTRYISLAINESVLIKFLKICESKKKTCNQVITKIMRKINKKNNFLAK